MGYLPHAVYLLSFAASGACAVLLGRAYAKTSARILLWSCLCFCLLASNNLVVIVDLIFFPDLDMRPIRHALSLSAVAVLIFGFIWDLNE